MSSLPSVRRVAQAFSQAAEHYDQVAGLQRQVADHLLKHCHTQLNGVVMDLGCGTGYVAKHLAQLTPVTSVLGIDIAPGMIDWCRQHIAYPRCQWMVADAQALPLLITVSIMWSPPWLFSGVPMSGHYLIILVAS